MHLSEIIITTLNQNQRAKLDTLLKKEESPDGDLGWQYQLTAFKAVLLVQAKKAKNET